MAAFNFPSSKPAAAAANNGTEAKTPVEYWGNVGKTLTLPVGPDGADEEVFISLGGIAFDRVQPAQVTTNSTDRWAIIAAAKNELLAIIKADYAVLEKGQAAIHPMLEVEVRHAGEAAAPATPANVISIVAKAMGKVAA